MIGAAVRFRTRPVEVDAVQWTGDNLRELEGLAGKPVTVTADGAATFRSHVVLVTLWPGEWLVRSARHGLAVMGDAEFAAAYEAVPDPTRDVLGEWLTFDTVMSWSVVLVGAMPLIVSGGPRGDVHVQVDGEGADRSYRVQWQSPRSSGRWREREFTRVDDVRAFLLGQIVVPDGPAT